MSSEQLCRKCGGEVDAWRLAHAAEPDLCDACSMLPRLAWIEELPPGTVLEIEDLRPLRGGHDPRRRARKTTGS